MLTKALLDNDQDFSFWPSYNSASWVRWHLDLGSYLHLPAVLEQLSVIVFSRQLLWKCLLVQEGEPRAHRWIGATRDKLEVMAQLWCCMPTSGCRETRSKGTRVRMPMSPPCCKWVTREALVPGNVPTYTSGNCKLCHAGQGQ